MLLIVVNRIDYQSYEWAKRVVFEPLKKYKVHMIVGNHDCYYKNTNDVNSPALLLEIVIKIFQLIVNQQKLK